MAILLSFNAFVVVGRIGKTVKNCEVAGIILCMRPANERRRYIVTSPLIGWAHTQYDPWGCTQMVLFKHGIYDSM